MEEVQELYFNEDQGVLYYEPNKDVKLTKVTLNGRPLKKTLQIHPVTTSKGAGVTPRHKVSAELLRGLNPLEIGPGSGEAIQVFSDRERTSVVATILYANNKSKDPVLKNLYQKYQSNCSDIHNLLHVIPNDQWHVDDLGGGKYCPLGFGSIPPGPNEQRIKFWQLPSTASSMLSSTANGFKNNKNIKHKIPFLRKTMLCPPINAISRNVAPILGQVGMAWKEFCPEEYANNCKLRNDAEDCMFPPAELQESTAEVFCNQIILRAIGIDHFVEMDRDDHEIALHTDETDYNTSLPLTFLSMRTDGGHTSNIESGYVPGSDLLIFEKKTGGRCVRVKTAVADTVVVVIFSSQQQLHGGVPRSAMEKLCKDDGHYYSIRVVPYFREPIVKFVEARRLYQPRNKQPPPPTSFVAIKANDGADAVAARHRPFNLESLALGQLVAARWGKKPAWYAAKVIGINPEKREVNVQWIEKRQKCGRTSAIKDPKLYSLDCSLPEKRQKQAYNTWQMEHMKLEKVCWCWMDKRN